MLNVTVFCFLASYVVALALEASRLWLRASISRFVMLAFATAGLVAHTMYLFNRYGDTHLPPLLGSTHDWMLVLAWIVVFFYLFVTAVDRDLPIGLFLLPVVLLFIGAAYFVSDAPKEIIHGQAGDVAGPLRRWAMLHATLLVFGIAGVILGFVLSMMYVVQHRRLKKHATFQTGLSLPSLEKLARLNWWAVVVSVPLLTAGMLTGVVLVVLKTSQSPEPFTFSDPVVIVNSAVVAAMLGFLAWLSGGRHPRGKQVAWTTIIAFGFLIFTFIGLQILTGQGPLNTWHTKASRRSSLVISHLSLVTRHLPVVSNCPPSPHHSITPSLRILPTAFRPPPSALRSPPSSALPRGARIR